MLTTVTIDLAIVICALGWLVSFLAPALVPGIRIDATLGLVLMALVGGLLALRQRKHEAEK